MGGIKTTIRLAVVSDIEPLTNIFQSSAEYHVELDRGFYTVPETEAVKAEFQKLVAASDITIMVAEAAGQVVGYVQLEILKPSNQASMIRPRAAADLGIAVLPGFRSQGVGKALVDAAEEWASQRGLDGLLLNCHTANQAAVRFYERLGYRVLGYVMEKQL